MRMLRSTNRRVEGVNAVAVSAGSYHFCAVTNEDAVGCWGQANHYQLGNAERVMSGIATPQMVRLDAGVVQVAANAGTTLALLNDGTVMAWGENAFGLLGSEDRSLQTPKPQRIAGLERMIQISVGQKHACALREDETVWCWGRGDEYQLGQGKAEDSRTPVRVVLP